MVALEALLDAYEEAVDAVAEAAEPAWYDPGYDVEFREDLDGTFSQDRDVNNLSVIAQAVRAGMPVIGWHPARRNAGEEERVLRASRQFTMAAQRIMGDFKAGMLGPDQMQAALSAAFVRQARNAFIAGKRALGNLAPLTAADDYDIARVANQAGLGDRPDPRGLGAVLARAMEQTNGTVPDDFRDRIDAYVGTLIERTMRRGFAEMVEKRAREREQKRAEAATALTAARAAAETARRDPDADVWAKRLADAKALDKKLRAQQAEAARRDRAAKAALVAAIQAQIARSRGKVRSRLGVLLRAVLSGRMSPQEASEQLQALVKQSQRGAYLDARRRGGGPAPKAGTTPEEDDALADEGDEGAEDFLADLPTPPPAVTLGMLLYWMFLDPWNLVDPDVIRFFDRKLRGIGERFYGIAKMGEKAAFRIGVQTPAVSQIETPPASLARDWLEPHPPTEQPTPLGETVLVWWLLGDAAKHCPDCLTLAESSPYSLDVFNQLGIYPGSGHTECEAHCRCGLSYDVATTVCGDNMADQFWESGITDVFVREASECRLPIDIDSLANKSSLSLDDPQVPDERAFDWDADIAQSITFGRPGVGIPSKARWLLDHPPGEARYVKPPGIDRASPVLTQRFELDGSSYVAVFQEDKDAIRFITGYVDTGPAVFHHEFTVASLRHFSQMASERGLRLDFDPRLINPGLRSFLKDIGASPIGPLRPPPQRVSDLRLPGGYPAVPLPAGAAAPPLGSMADYSIPVMPAWERPVPLAHTWNGKAVIQVGFRSSKDRREALKRLRELLDFKRPVPTSFTTAQIDSIVARAEVFRAIGLDSSIGTGFRAMDEAGLAGEAFRDGTIKLKPTAGLAGQVTAADSFGDLWAHEYGHLVAERLRATEPGFEAKLLDWAERNYGITDYALADPGEAFAELFAIMTRPDYVIGRIDGDVEIWAALRRTGLWHERARVGGAIPALPVFPADIQNLFVDGKLLPGWTDVGEKAAGKLGGTTKRTILRDATGQEWLFKPDGIEAEVAGSALTRLFGLNAAPVGRVLYDTEWGSIQPIIGPDLTSFGRIAIESTSPYEARELFAHQLVDYIIGNWDGHAGHYVRDKAGRVWAVDRAFAFISTPGAPLAAQRTLWDTVFRRGGAPRSGSIASRFFAHDAQRVAHGGGAPFIRMVDPDEVAAVLARFDAVSDDSFRAVARAGADSEQGLIEMARRKSAIRAEVEDLFGRLYDEVGGNPAVFPPGSVWHEWAKTRRFEAKKLRMADEVKPLPALNVKAIINPKESGFFRDYSPAQVRDALAAHLYPTERQQLEGIIRSAVTLWKSDVSVIPTDWQVWSYRGGTFTAPSMATPPGPGLSTKQYGLWGGLPPAPALKPVPKTEPHWWQSQYQPAGPAPEKLPLTPWPGDQWLVPKDGPVDEALVTIAGSDVPLNSPLEPWSGAVPFEDPPLPEGAIVDWQRAELQEKADEAWYHWEDVKAGTVKYAIAFGKAESDDAIKAGLLSENIGGTWYIGRGKKAMQALRDAYESGADLNSDWFWLNWLGYSQARLDAIDAYEAARKAKGIRAGMLIVEPDGRMWFQAPRNQYAGYENTWSKGGIDAGETPPQAAVREAREELGISVEVDDYLGDFVSSDGGSITRYYIGHRTGGGPRFAATKETYAIRLGTPEQVRPVMLRYGKLDKRDTEVLDAFLAHQGLPPVAPVEIGPRSLGRAIDDVANPDLRATSGLPATMGYDPAEVSAMAALYAPTDVQGGGKFWKTSSPWGTSESTFLPGFGWVKLKLTALTGDYDQSAMKLTVGNFLAVAKTYGQNGLKVSVGGAWLDNLTPVFDRVGANLTQLPVPPGITIGTNYVMGYNLSADQVTAMVKLLEDGSVLPITPTVAVPVGSTGALAQTLSPPDPLGPHPPAAATTGSFSAHPAAATTGSFAGTFGLPTTTSSKFISEVPGPMDLTHFSYKTADPSISQSIKFSRNLYGQIMVPGTQTWFAPSTASDRAALLLDAIVRWSDEMLDSTSPIDTITISKWVVQETKLEEVLTAFGFTMKGPNDFWYLDDVTKVGALHHAIITDAMPAWVSMTPGAPLAHGAQATAVSPAVAHVVTPPVTPLVTPLVTSPAAPAFAVKYTVDAKALKSLTANPLAYQTLLPTGKAAHDFGFPSGTSIHIEWNVTKNGNLRMTKFENVGTHDEGAAGFLTWLDDMATHMQAVDLGKTEHLAVTFTDDVWQTLPPGVVSMLNDNGAHPSTYGGMVLGRKKTIDLVAMVDAQMTSFVPPALTPPPGAVGAVPSTMPPPPVTPAPPPTVTKGLAAKMGHDETPSDFWDIQYKPNADVVVKAVGYGDQILTTFSPIPAASAVVLVKQEVVGGAYGVLQIIQPGTKQALMGYVNAITRLPYALVNMTTPAAPLNGWTVLIPPAVLQAHPSLSDFLKQVGGTMTSDGSMALNPTALQKAANHLMDDTLPIPTAGGPISATASAVIPGDPPPPSLFASIKMPGTEPYWDDFAQKVLYPQESVLLSGPPGSKELLWNVYGNQVTAEVVVTVPVVTNQIVRLRILDVGGPAENGFIGALLSSKPGMGVDVADSLKKKLPAFVVEAMDWSPVVNSSMGTLWRLEPPQVEALRIAYLNELATIAVPTASPLSVLPAAKTVLGSGNITQADAVLLKVATTPTKQGSFWTWPNGPLGTAGAQVYAAPSAAVIQKLNHDGYEGGWELIASMLAMPPGMTVGVDPAVLQGLPPDLVQTITAMSFEPGSIPGLMFGPPELQAFQSQVNLELLTALPTGVYPPTLTGTGATVAQPLTGGTMPIAKKANLGPDYDPEAVSKWLLAEDHHIHNYGGTSGANTDMKVAMFTHPNGEPATAVAWRRLGNRLEIWKASTGGFVAQLRRMDAMMKANPKLTNLTIKPGAVTSPELIGFLSQYAPMKANGQVLSPAWVASIVADLDADVMALQALPPAGTLSPLASIPNYSPSTALQSVPFSEPNVVPTYLTGAKKTVKMATYGAAVPSGTSISWRRLGNHLQVFHVTSGGATFDQAGNHVLAHIRRMAEVMDDFPKVDGVTFWFPAELPDAVRDSLKAMGATEKSGKLYLTRQQVLDVRDALKADAALPAPAAVVAPPPPPPPTSALQKANVPDYDAPIALSLESTESIWHHHPLLGGANDSMKVTQFYLPPLSNNTYVGSVSWRRLGNRLEIWDWDDVAATGPNPLLAHLSKMADLIDTSPKFEGLIIRKPLGNAILATTLIDDFGATLDAKGFLRMTPAQVQAVRDALKLDAGLTALPPAITAPAPAITALPPAPAAVPTPVTALPSAAVPQILSTSGSNVLATWPQFTLTLSPSGHPGTAALAIQSTAPPMTDEQVKGLFTALLQNDPNKGLLFDDSDLFYTFKNQQDALKALALPGPSVYLSLVTPTAMVQYIGGVMPSPVAAAIPSPAVVLPPPAVSPTLVPTGAGGFEASWPGGPTGLIVEPYQATVADAYWYMTTLSSSPLSDEQAKGLFAALLDKNPNMATAIYTSDFDQTLSLQKTALAPLMTWNNSASVLTPDAMKAYIFGSVPSPAAAAPSPTAPATYPNLYAAMPTVTPSSGGNVKFEWGGGTNKLVAVPTTIGLGDVWKLQSVSNKPLTPDEIKGLFASLLAQQPGKSLVLDESDFDHTLSQLKAQLLPAAAPVPSPGVPAWTLTADQMQAVVSGVVPAPARLPSANIVVNPAFQKMLSVAPTPLGKNTYLAKLKFSAGKHGHAVSVPFSLTYTGGLKPYWWNWALYSVEGQWAGLYWMAQYVVQGAIPFSKGAKGVTSLIIEKGVYENTPGLVELAAQMGVSVAAPGANPSATALTFDPSQAAEFAALIKANKMPSGVAAPAAYVPPVTVPAQVSGVPSPTYAAAAAKVPTGPPKPPPPADTLWVPPAQSAAAAHAALNQVVIPDAKSISKQMGYDRTEVKQYLALGSSEVDLGQVTVNLIPQDAKAAKWVTSGNAVAVEARFASRPNYSTLAFTDMLPAPGVDPAQQEAALWASLQQFARDQAERADDAGNLVPKADLFITDDIYLSRPGLKQLLLDVGGNEYIGDVSGAEPIVRNVTLGTIVKPAGEPDADPFIHGRDFWRAYGDGIRLNKDQAKVLADALESDTLDTALQGSMLAAAPPPPVTKVVPTGAKDNEPIRYLGVHPDHLYLAGNEVIGEDGLRAVSRWAKGAYEATWLRTPNVLEWRSIRISGSPTDVTVRAATARHLYVMLEDLGAHSGQVLDVYASAYEAMPDLRDLLLRYKGRMVPAAGNGESFIRLNASEAGLLRIDLQLELGAMTPLGQIKPVVDPIIWPAPSDLKQAPKTINGKKVAGQTPKAIYEDSAGNLWLFKPGATGRGTHADQAVFALSQLLGLRLPPVHEYTLMMDGKLQTGTLQRVVIEIEHIKQVDQLTPEQQDAMVQHSLLDWLTANDDAHIGNVMVNPTTGDVWAIDKTRSWKGMGELNDSLNPDLNGQGGPGLAPVINLWWRAVRQDPTLLANVSPKSIGRTLRYIESIDDETFLRILGPVLDDWEQIPTFRRKSRQAFIDAVLRRKHSVKVDIETQFKREIVKLQAANPAIVPKEWSDWVTVGGGEFKLLASPHEQVMEELADLDRLFGSHYTATRYKDLMANPVGVSPAVAQQARDAVREANRYSGSGITSQTGASAYAGGSAGGVGSGGSKFGAESIRIGREEGFDYITKVNTWSFLHQLFDPSVTVTDAVAELRAAYNPDLGLFIMRRGVRGAGDPATYMATRMRTGFRSTMGGSWGSGPTRYVGGGPQMTVAIRPDQVFMSSVHNRGGFQVGGEAEIIFRDLRPEQVVHMDRGGHDWRVEFGLTDSGYSGSDYSNLTTPKRAEVYRRIWALYGGPQTGPIR